MKVSKLGFLAAATLTLATSSFSATYYGGFEDWAGSISDYDYNDTIFTISGSGLVLNSAGQYFSKPVLNTVGMGSPFWNNSSLDGLTENIGYCVYGGGNCGIAPLNTNALYLATALGGSANDVTFNGNGAAVSITINASITAGSDRLGYEYVGSSTPVYFTSSSFTFVPTSAFVLVGENGTGPVFTSNTGNPSQFAFFAATIPPAITAAPEPTVFGLLAVSIVIGVCLRGTRG